MDDFRSRMLTDRHISHLVDYPNSSQVFPGVDLKSGVCFFLRGRDYQGDCAVTLVRDETVGPTSRRLDEYDVFIRDERAARILKKVLDRKEPSFSDLLTGDTPFGLATNFTGFRAGNPKQGEIRVYASSNVGRRSGVMSRSQIKKNTQLIDAWKVLAPKAGPGSSGGHIIPDMVLGKPITAEPNSVCTQTWIVAGPLASQAEAESVASYLTTRLARFIVSLRKISQDAMKGVYLWLPQQPWVRTWTDDELYKKYGITADEQAYIEAMIRPMEAAD